MTEAPDWVPLAKTLEVIAPVLVLTGPSQIGPVPVDCSQYQTVLLAVTINGTPGQDGKLTLSWDDATGQLIAQTVVTITPTTPGNPVGACYVAVPVAGPILNVSLSGSWTGAGTVRVELSTAHVVTTPRVWSAPFSATGFVLHTVAARAINAAATQLYYVAPVTNRVRLLIPGTIAASGLITFTLSTLQGGLWYPSAATVSNLVNTAANGGSQAFDFLMPFGSALQLSVTNNDVAARNYSFTLLDVSDQ